MTVTNTTMASVDAIQTLLTSMTVLGLTTCHFPAGVTIPDGAVLDFIVVGSGPGGSTLANRLTEDGTTTVALIEAGGVPPMQSTYAGLFTVLPNSEYDWNATSVNDNYANQCLQNHVVEMTMGKMLGGSSSLHHSIEVTGNEYDYLRWAKAANDTSYTLENMRQYLKKRESLQDSEILNEYPSYHGTTGPIVMKREYSEKNDEILAAFNELGHNIILDINANETLGCNVPLLAIGDVWRQSAAETYLRQAKNRSNLYVQLNALVTKVYINSSNVATGVQILTSDGTYKTINARKEVILSAGALKTPQILMLSGVGPKDHLDDFNITVLADLPVCNQVFDHLSASVVYTLGANNETTISDPSKFPVPMTTTYVSLDGSEEPTYQAINLYFSHDSSGLAQLCVFVFKYNNTVCAPIVDANVGTDVLYSVINLMNPASSGKCQLKNTDPTDNLEVYLGHMSNSTDLTNLAKALQDFNSIVNTTYFKSVNSSMVFINLTACSDLEKDSYDYFECYARYMSSTMWHYSSTSAIGKVLDNYMMVKGIDNLRVVDASAMPRTISGNIESAIYALAEKAADLIKDKYELD